MQTYECPSGHLVLLDDDVELPGGVSIGSHGYAQIFVDGRVTLLHRWLMGRTVGDGTFVDHRNRYKMDCRRQNLRVTDAAGNSQNVPRTKGNAYPCKGRWQARVKLAGKIHHLGTYDSADQARAVSAAFRLKYMPMAVP